MSTAQLSQHEMSRTIIVGLSGPSSSGKTTVARLSRDIIHCHSNDLTNHRSVRLFILHEDDFYKTDTEIPTKVFSSPEYGTRELQDWDCVESLDLPLLRSTLTYVREYDGKLPPAFVSKEDTNTIGPSGVTDEQRLAWHDEFQKWMASLSDEPQNINNDHQMTPATNDNTPAESSPRIHKLTICVLDGFLLYPPPSSPHGSQLRELHDILEPLLDVKLFVPGTREKTIDRRTKRDGYVTLEGFWADPPGFVQDVVWPGYRRDHGWLFRKPTSTLDKAGEGDHSSGKTPILADLQEAIDSGKVNREIAKQHDILVGPGEGNASISEVALWTYDMLKNEIGRAFTKSL